MSADELQRHLWASYKATIDERQKYGDVNLLAEAAERNDWSGAPEMGEEIARLLRHAYVGEKKDRASKHYLVVRNREIVGLAKIHAAENLSQKESFERIAKIYGMSIDAIRKVVEREGLDR